MKRLITNSAIGNGAHDPHAWSPCAGNRHPRITVHNLGSLLVLVMLICTVLSGVAVTQTSTWALGAANWNAPGAWTGGDPDGRERSAAINNVAGQAETTLNISPVIVNLSVGRSTVPAVLKMNASEILTLTGKGKMTANIAGRVLATGATQNFIYLSDPDGGGTFVLSNRGELVVDAGSELNIVGGDFANYNDSIPALVGGNYILKGTLYVEDLGPVHQNLARITLSGANAQLRGGRGFGGEPGNALSSLRTNGKVFGGGALLKLESGATLSLDGILGNYEVIRIDARSTLNVKGGYDQWQSGWTEINGNLNTGGAVDFHKDPNDPKRILWTGSGSINGTRITDETRGRPGTFPSQRKNPSDGISSDSGEAQLSPEPSYLTVNCDYEQTSSGVLEIDMNSSGYGGLKVNGAVTLLGALEVSLLDGFAPSPTDEYVILVAQDGIVGGFSNAPPGGTVSVVGGGTFRVNYFVLPNGSTTVTLSDYSPSLSTP